MAAVNPGIAPVPVTPGDRFTFTVFLALAIHAAVILGVTFTYNPNISTSEIDRAASPNPRNFLKYFPDK